MNNQQFLKLLAKSFYRYIQTDPRSNAKLKILHGEIAKDINKKLGSNFSIKSLGFENGKEGKLIGRYVDKNVDLLISNKKENFAGIGVKFVMSNYSQNSNNYFENMLGETANIRCNDKKYFQILIIPEKIPYFKKGGEISKWEEITQHNIDKYVKLSKDNHDIYLHTPIKTLLYIIKLPKCDYKKIINRKEYLKYYLGKKNISIKLSTKKFKNFSSGIIYNNYASFIDKVVYYIKSI